MAGTPDTEAVSRGCGTPNTEAAANVRHSMQRQPLLLDPVELTRLRYHSKFENYLLLLHFGNTKF